MTNEWRLPVTDEIKALRDDIAFMRALSEDSGGALSRDAAVLIAVGVIFGLNAFRFWGIEAGFLDWAKPTGNWMGLDALAVFLIALLTLMRRFRAAARGAASRAMGAAWGSVGIAISVAVTALVIGAWRLQLPLLVIWVFPLILFTLYGAAWWIAFAVKRRIWFAGIAIGSFITALGCGFRMGRSDEWAILSLGLFLWVAAPGVAILREAHATA
jgi:hypothetical protein